MNRITLILIGILLLLQYSFWFGKGSIVRVWHLNDLLAQKTEEVAQLKQRNDALAAQINDLKVGNEAIEELARYELGMIRQGEIFFQILKDPLPSEPTAY